MKNVVNYYTAHGSHIFVSFVVFSKAYDKVNYWKLFNMLLHDNIDRSVVAILAHWYSKQHWRIHELTMGGPNGERGARTYIGV